jgi:MioC protein
MSSRRIGIFVATMTGLAEICAEEVASVLEAARYHPKIWVMDGLGATVIDDIDAIIIVSSTYGHGDIPDNGQIFFEALEAHDSLAGKAFAVFALGDRTYADTFCHAGEKWDELLAAKGASRIVPLERHDASAGTLAEDEASAWATRWASQLKLAF